MAVFLIFAAAPAASAYDLELGVVGGATQNPYKGASPSWMALPYVAFDSEYAFLSFPSAGIHLVDNELVTLNAVVSYLSLEFKRSDTDDAILKTLDERKFSLGAGLEAALNTGLGTFKLSVLADVLGRSDGLYASADYSYPFMLTDTFAIIPNAGVTWTNNKHNDYYFGISPAESARSGLRAYNAGSSFTPLAGLSAVYQANEHIRLAAGTECAFLPSEAKNSPMVSKKRLWGGFVLAVYAF